MAQGPENGIVVEPPALAAAEFGEGGLASVGRCRAKAVRRFLQQAPLEAVNEAEIRLPLGKGRPGEIGGIEVAGLDQALQADQQRVAGKGVV